MQNTIFIAYYIPDKFLHHFDELSSHTTVAWQNHSHRLYGSLDSRYSGDNTSGTFTHHCPQFIGK